MFMFRAIPSVSSSKRDVVFLLFCTCPSQPESTPGRKAVVMTTKTGVRIPTVIMLVDTRDHLSVETDWDLSGSSRFIIGLQHSPVIPLYSEIVIKTSTSYEARGLLKTTSLYARSVFVVFHISKGPFAAPSVVARDYLLPAFAGYYISCIKCCAFVVLRALLSQGVVK